MFELYKCIYGLAVCIAHVITREEHVFSTLELVTLNKYCCSSCCLLAQLICNRIICLPSSRAYRVNNLLLLIISHVDTRPTWEAVSSITL